MKVEQLKAELVVFKGLMSNVSSDFPLGSQGPSDGLRALPFSVLSFRAVALRRYLLDRAASP